MIENRHVESDLVDFLNDWLSTEERQKIEAHLSQCANCRAQAETLEKTFQTLRSAEEPAPPESYWRNFLPRLHQRISGREDRRFSTANVESARWIQRFLIPTAALVAAALILSQIHIVPIEEGSSSDLRQIVAQMDVEELQSAAKVAAPKLLPDPLSHSDVVIASEETTRSIVDSLFAFRSVEVERVAEISLLGQNEVGVESLTEDELKTVLTRLGGVNSL